MIAGFSLICFTARIRVIAMRSVNIANVAARVRRSDPDDRKTGGIRDIREVGRVLVIVMARQAIGLWGLAHRVRSRVVRSSSGVAFAPAWQPPNGRIASGRGVEDPPAGHCRCRKERGRHRSGCPTARERGSAGRAKSRRTFAPCSPGSRPPSPTSPATRRWSNAPSTHRRLRAAGNSVDGPETGRRARG